MKRIFILLIFMMMVIPLRASPPEPSLEFIREILAFPAQAQNFGPLNLASPGPIGATTPSTILSYNVNNKQVMEGVKYPFTEAGVQSCINDAITNPDGAHICDATAVPSITLATELAVGNASAQPVTLILPQAATWSVSITDGVHCGIRQYDRSGIYGFQSATNALEMVISAASAATNVEGLYCTEDAPSGGGTYVHAEGFQVSNTVGATMAKGAAIAQHTFDDTQFSNIAVVNTNGVAWKIFDTCCGTSFINVLGDGHSGSGARPCVLGDSVLGGASNVNGGVLDTSFIGLSCTHPGSGQVAVEIGDATNSSGNNLFDLSDTFTNLYIEPNASDTTTAMIRLRPAVNGMVFNGAVEAANIGGSTAYMFQIDTWAGPANNVFQGVRTATNHCYNDLVYGVTILGAGSSTQICPAYTGTTFEAPTVLVNALGTAASPSLQFVGNGGNTQNCGFFQQLANLESVECSGTDIFSWFYSSSGNAGTNMCSTCAYRWSGSANSTSATATGLSQPSAGVVSVDTTTQGNALGSLKAAGYQLTNAFASSTAPTIAAGGCGGTNSTISAPNGTASFEILIGSGGATAAGCTVTMPAATTSWTCNANTVSATSTTNFLVKQTGVISTTSVTIQNFSDVGAATAFGASDTIRVKCAAN